MSFTPSSLVSRTVIVVSITCISRLPVRVRGLHAPCVRAPHDDRRFVIDAAKTGPPRIHHLETAGIAVAGDGRPEPCQILPALRVPERQVVEKVRGIVELDD